MRGGGLHGCRAPVAALTLQTQMLAQVAAGAFGRGVDHEGQVAQLGQLALANRDRLGLVHAGVQDLQQVIQAGGHRALAHAHGVGCAALFLQEGGHHDEHPLHVVAGVDAGDFTVGDGDGVEGVGLVQGALGTQQVTWHGQADEAGARGADAFQSDQAAAQLPDAIAFAGQEKVFTHGQ